MNCFRKWGTARRDQLFSLHGLGKIIIWGIGIMALSMGVAVGSEGVEGGRAGEESISTGSIQEVLREHAGELMSLHGVVGTGLSLCNDQPCIKVFVMERTPALEKEIQSILKGHPFAIKESGPFRARPEDRK